MIMAATKGNENPSIYRQSSSKHGVFEDDFLYGVTVAQSSIDYRLGKGEMKLFRVNNFCNVWQILCCKIGVVGI